LSNISLNSSVASLRPECPASIRTGVRDHRNSQYEDIKEIPKGQRYINRPSLEEIFKGEKVEKRKRDRGVEEAVRRWGYSQGEVSDYLGLHYSTVSRLMKEIESKTSKFKT